MVIAEKPLPGFHGDLVRLSFHRVVIGALLPHGIRPKEGENGMFGKTREKLEDKYIGPVRQYITLVGLIAVAALLIAIAALMKGE